MARERFYNSATQPDAPDCLVASDYNAGDGVLIVNVLPSFIGLDGFSVGDQFRVKGGDTLFLVTDLGLGNVNWVVTVSEGTVDGPVLLTGTPIYLDLTAGAVEDGIRAFDFLTATDRTADGLPNSVVAPVDGAAGVASLRTLGTGATQAAAGDDARLSDDRTPTAHEPSHAKGGSDELPIEDLATMETDTTLVFAPNGAGGIAARAETGGGGGVSGHYEIIVSGGGPPPDFLTTPDGTDYLYGLVP